MSVFIIAEAGVNHNGDILLAERLVDEAVNAGADAVKFQTFVASSVISRSAQKADYQKASTGAGESQLDMVKKLELSFEEFEVLKAYCEDRGIMFLSTAFDLESLAFLNEIDVPMHKVPSGEITNLPYLERVAASGKPIILSTGMAVESEVEAAVAILKKGGAKDITVLHCTTEYPAPYDEINLNAMRAMGERLGCAYGYSDHSVGIEVAVAAAALGASVIEKHFTLDKEMEGPDHSASLEPNELKAMVKAIRNVEAAMGSEVKQPSESELRNIDIVRRSIVAAVPVKKGERFTEYNITAKRPAGGISPMRWYEVLGTKAKRDYDEDEMVEL